jgi:hypothetical protein
MSLDNEKFWRNKRTVKILKAIKKYQSVYKIH